MFAATPDKGPHAGAVQEKEQVRAKGLRRAEGAEGGTEGPTPMRRALLLMPVLTLTAFGLAGCGAESKPTKACSLCRGSGQGARGACTWCYGRGYTEVSGAEADRQRLSDENWQRIARGEEPLTPLGAWWEKHGKNITRFLAIGLALALAGWWSTTRRGPAKQRCDGSTSHPQGDGGPTKV